MKQPTNERETSGHIGLMFSHDGEKRPKQEAEGRKVRFEYTNVPQRPPPASSGQLGPNSPDSGNGRRRPDRGGRRFRSEHGESPPGSPKWQKAEKSEQDSEQVRPSDCLRHDGDSSGPTSGPDKKAARNGRRMEKSKLRAEKSGAKLNVAREKFAAKKPSKPPGVIKMLMKKAGVGAWYYAHQKTHEVEYENVGVEAAHKTELTGEGAVRGITRFVKHRVRTHPVRRVAKLEKRDIRARADFAYRKLVQEHPEIKSNPASRYWQKQRLKRWYTKQARMAAKGAAATVKKIASAAWGLVTSHPVAALIVLCVFILIFVLQSCVASMGTIGNGILGAVGSTTYLAKDADIDRAELAYTGWEADLQLQINIAKSTHPGYDEYRYNIAVIYHSPYELMAFLTAVYGDFTYSGVEDVLEQVFNNQYELQFLEQEETRYRTETRTGTATITDPITGETTTSNYTYEVQVPYQWRILNINLTAKSFTDVVFPRMDSEQLQCYNVYMASKGNRQYLRSPFFFNWLPYVTGYYGYYADSSTETKEYRRGVNIGVPSGTEILAGQDGTVTFAGDDSSGGRTVVLDNGGGLVSKYAHCGMLLVSAGQTVKAGDAIAITGNSGMYLEIDKDGRSLNPLYFVLTGDNGLGIKKNLFETEERF